jgi:hypothetical protein
LKPISASHIGVETLCKRRERFAYGHLNLREGGSTATEAGSKTHKVIEDGGPWDAVWGEFQIGAMARKLADATLPGVVSREENFTETLHGIPFTGFIDFTTATVVGDYKTTSKKRNVKSISTLLTDPQRLLYVEVKRPEATMWLYGDWESYSVTPREIRTDKEDRERFKLHVLKPAEEIAARPHDMDPLSLPANLESCRLYPIPGKPGSGGCPYKDRCFPANQSVTKLGLGMSALLERLEREKAEREAAGPGINSPGVVLPPPPEEPKKKKQVVEKVVDVPKTSEPDPRQPGPAPFTQGMHLIDTLYVDCMPLTSDEPVIPSYKLIVPAGQTVADDQGVLSAMLIDYGKGGPMLACQVVDNLRRNPVKYVYLESRSAEGKAVSMALMGVARVVVKGVF